MKFRAIENQVFIEVIKKIEANPAIGDEKKGDLKGIYFSDGKVVKTSVDSYNKVFQKSLWNGSLELTKTTFTEEYKETSEKNGSR